MNTTVSDSGKGKATVVFGGGTVVIVILGIWHIISAFANITKPIKASGIDIALLGIMIIAMTITAAAINHMNEGETENNKFQKSFADKFLLALVLAIVNFGVAVFAMQSVQNLWVFTAIDVGVAIAHPILFASATFASPHKDGVDAT